jgi:uncharacterized PurR-regulated membrane protein YhhQ (DUF165 family)
LTAFCVGDLVDDKIFRYFRVKNREKYAGKENMRGFAFRALVSSLAGHILDSNIFVLIAFAFIMPWNVLLGMIVLNIIIKWAYEWAVIPITFRVTKWAGQRELAYAEQDK